MTHPAELLSSVVALARQAGGEILEIYDGEHAVQYKRDHSPLTAADLAAHRCLTAGLARLTADVPQLSEESTDIS